MSFHSEVLLCLLPWKMKINEEKLHFHWPLSNTLDYLALLEEG